MLGIAKVLRQKLICKVILKFQTRKTRYETVYSTSKTRASVLPLTIFEVSPFP